MNDEKILYEMPSARDSERALIGAVVQSGETWGVALQVEPSNFENNLLGDIWKTIRELQGRGTAVDVITVSEAVTSSDLQTFEIGALLTAMVTEVPNQMNMEAYANNVLTTSLKRKIIRERLPRLTNMLYDDGFHSPEEVVAGTQAVFDDLAEGVVISSREQWTFAEVCELEDQEYRFLIPEWLPLSGIAVLAGDTSAGKSFAALDLVVGVGSGTGAWGFDIVREGAVIYLGRDNMLSDVRKRITEICASRGITPTEVDAVLDMSPVDLSKPGGIAVLRGMVQEHQAVLVVIDNISKYIGSYDENSAKDIGKLFGDLRDITRATGVTFLMIHNLGKEGSKLNKRSLQDRFRGSVEFIYSADSGIGITKTGTTVDPIRTILHIKQRSLAAKPLQLSIVSDEDDPPVVGELRFSPGDEEIAAETLTTQVASMYATLLRESPDKEMTRKELRAGVVARGMTVSERTHGRASRMLSKFEGIETTKRGRGRETTYQCSKPLP